MKYDSYKPSGIEWIGDIPSHWDVEKIKYIFEETSTKNYGKETMLASSQSKGVIPKDELEKKSVEAVVTDLNVFKLVRKGNFVISLRSFEGGIEYSKYQGIISPAYTILKSKIKIDDSFFKNLFKSYKFIDALNIHKTGIREGQNISFKKLKDDYLVLPPKSEQKVIADFLDKKCESIDTYILKQQELIKLLKEKKSSLISRVVTRGLDTSVEYKKSGIEWLGDIPKHWGIKKLKYLCKINRKTINEKSNPSLEINYVDIGSVTFENGINKVEKYCFKNAPSRARRLVNFGDTVVSTVRTYLKAISYINEESSKYVYSTGFAVLNPNKGFNNEYFTFMIKSDSFTEQVNIDSKGMSYPAINSTDLGNLFLCFPNFEEQNKIVKYIEKESKKTDDVISNIEDEIKLLQEYKQSIISSAVTGKIKV